MFLIPSLIYLVVQSDLFCFSSPPLLPYDDDVVIGGPPPPHLIKITCSGERERGQSAQNAGAEISALCSIAQAGLLHILLSSAMRCEW